VAILLIDQILADGRYNHLCFAPTTDQYLVDRISEGDNSTEPVPSGTEDEGSHPVEGVVLAGKMNSNIVFTQ